MLMRLCGRIMLLGSTKDRILVKKRAGLLDKGICVTDEDPALFSYM